MHVKYAVLHCSYSVPVRVCDIADESAARDVTTGMLFGALYTGLRTAMLPLRAVVFVFSVVRVDDDVRALVVRGAVLRSWIVVDFRRWVVVRAELAFFARIATLPSRTAASDPCVNTKQDIIKSKNLLIFLLKY